MLNKLKSIKTEPVVWVLLSMPAFVYDAWIFTGVRAGRDMFLVRTGEPGILFGILGLVGFYSFLLIHAMIALRRKNHVDHSYGHPSLGHRKLQKFSGIFIGIFLLFHIRHTAYIAGVEGIGAGGLYERIRNDLDSYPWLALYISGTAAIAFHFGQGVWALSNRVFQSNRGIAIGLGLVGIILSFAFFALGIDAISMYATGGLLWGRSHSY